MAVPRIAEPDFKERVEQSFARQAVMKLIGAQLTRCEPGVVEVELPFRADLTQQHGFLHAGIVSTALDSVCAYSALTMMPADAAVLTIEFKVNLLAPGKGDHFLFRGFSVDRTFLLISWDLSGVIVGNKPCHLVVRKL
jgi:uncharacterized protein (TIGR00369 family)